MRGRGSIFILFVLAACTSFSKGENLAAEGDAGNIPTSEAGTSSPIASDAAQQQQAEAGAGDGRLFEKLACAGAILCEPFNDNNLEGRGWVRSGQAIVVDQKLKTSINIGSDQLSSIKHTLSARSSPARIRINATILLLEGSSPDRSVDLLEYRKRGSSTGVYLSIINTQVVFGTFYEPTNLTSQRSIGMRFETPTNVLIVIDYVQNVARFTRESEPGTPIPAIEYPLPEVFPASQADLLVGFSYVSGAVGVQYNALFDDVIVNDL